MFLFFNGQGLDTIAVVLVDVPKKKKKKKKKIQQGTGGKTAPDFAKQESGGEDVALYTHLSLEPHSTDQA